MNCIKKNITYSNARLILKLIEERLQFQYLNEKIEKNPKDILIDNLNNVNKKLKKENGILQEKLDKKISNRIRDFLENFI